MKVCIGCGHCLTGADTGARDILIEENETRKVQDVVLRYLENNGIQVKKARIDKAGSVNESLAYRVNVSDNWGADLYIEIHLNSGGGHGTETYCIGNGTGHKYATQIVNSIAKLGYTNRGVKDGSNLYVVRKTKASAVLVECCFVDSQSDANMWNVENMGKAIAEGILGHAVVANNATTPVNNVKNSTETNNEEMYVEVKTFCNGSTREKIYTNNKHENLVGSLDPYEKCKCLGVHNGHAIVMYTGANGYDKVGFTESTVWQGCIK